MTCNSSVIKFLFICFLFFLVFRGFFLVSWRRQSRFGKHFFFFKSLLPFLFHIYWWMPSFDLHFSFFEHQIFFGTPTDCFAFTPFPSPLVQTFFSSVLFSIQCITLNSDSFMNAWLSGILNPWIFLNLLALTSKCFLHLLLQCRQRICGWCPGQN